MIGFNKRVIKPWHGRFIILWKLRKQKDQVIVFDADNAVESRKYRRVNSLLGNLAKRGLVIYGRDLSKENIDKPFTYMLASITIDGRDYIKRKIEDWIFRVFQFAAGIYAIIKLCDRFL